MLVALEKDDRVVLEAAFGRLRGRRHAEDKHQP
jgi:hypothetical protein